MQRVAVVAQTARSEIHETENTMPELADTMCDVTVPVPATLFKGWKRQAETTITVADGVSGRGSSRKAATADAAAQVATALQNLTAKPAIVRKADGSMWFLYAHREGTEYRHVTPDGRVTGVTTITSGTPTEVADSIIARHDHVGIVRVL